MGLKGSGAPGGSGGPKRRVPRRRAWPFCAGRRAAQQASGARIAARLRLDSAVGILRMCNCTMQGQSFAPTYSVCIAFPLETRCLRVYFFYEPEIEDNHALKLLRQNKTRGPFPNRDGLLFFFRVPPRDRRGAWIGFYRSGSCPDNRPTPCLVRSGWLVPPGARPPRRRHPPSRKTDSSRMSRFAVAGV